MVSSILTLPVALPVGIEAVLRSYTIWFLSGPIEMFGPMGFWVERLLLVLFSVNLAVSLGVQTLDSVMVREFLLSCFSILILYSMHVSSGPVASFVTGIFPVIKISYLSCNCH